MKEKKMNLFIVDDNKLMVIGLKQYLENRFGDELNISTFYDGESCLGKIKEDTHLVILDFFLEGKNGGEILRSIKAINPAVEVIIQSSNDDLQASIDAFEMGAADYVVKDQHALMNLTTSIQKYLNLLKRKKDYHKYKRAVGSVVGYVIFILSLAAATLYFAP